MDRIRLEVKLDSLIGVYDNAEWQVKLVFRNLTADQKKFLPEWFRVARQVASELLASQNINDYRAGLEAERLAPRRKRRDEEQSIEDLL